MQVSGDDDAPGASALKVRFDREGRGSEGDDVSALAAVNWLGSNAYILYV